MIHLHERKLSSPADIEFANSWSSVARASDWANETVVRPASARSNEYPQFMFLSRNKKNNVHPCKPQFNYIKVGFKGVNIILAWFLMN